MRQIVEKLLEDVDPDIKELMLSDHVPEPGTVTIASYASGPSKVWEQLQDPLFFIIQWQELRHENRHVKED
jgi:hypothetical protein